MSLMKKKYKTVNVCNEIFVELSSFTTLHTNHLKMNGKLIDLNQQQTDINYFSYY